MIYRMTIGVLLSGCIAAGPAFAQEIGSAAGKGTIDHLLPTGNSEQVSFTPRYSSAYTETQGGKQYTWIVLTEKDMPMKSWSVAKEPGLPQVNWCEKEHASFVAVKLDAEWKVDLYFLCPAVGGLNTEMLSSANGLDSVQVTFDVRDGKRLKGALRTGVGSCPGADGMQAYCTQTGDYTFDAVFAK